MTSDSLRLLFIDDGKVEQMAFKHFIRSSNLTCDCTIASSLKEALSWMAKQDFDVIVSDYVLPDGVGLDLIRNEKKIPVILVSGLGDEETESQAMKMGAFGYLVKSGGSQHLIQLQEILKKIDA